MESQTFDIFMCGFEPEGFIEVDEKYFWNYFKDKEYRLVNDNAFVVNNEHVGHYSHGFVFDQFYLKYAPVNYQATKFITSILNS